MLGGNQARARFDGAANVIDCVMAQLNCPNKTTPKLPPRVPKYRISVPEQFNTAANNKPLRRPYLSNIQLISPSDT